ncbi:MOSC-domain-containing protein [Trichodelitschia bisporula]|uniref:MOSC-domain-containing protein n=1 Tax=Trichodelitschia bisporula TaxID=703511 RepID=A0A6G1HNA4_9PEZI|nr:MOSC-domain-containing protein [Trichodelitschia bisporula]
MGSLTELFTNVEFTAGNVFIRVFFFFAITIIPLLFFFESRITHQIASTSDIPKPPPTKVKQLRVYPIKSCRGIVVQKAKVFKTGLDLDRNWMFVDATTWKFLTIRQLSAMTLINTALTENDELEISISGAPDLKVKIAAHPSKDWLKANTELVEVEIWGTKTDAWAYAADLAAPFCKFLDKDIRLVYKGPSPRVLRGSGAPKVLGRTQSTKFADMMPVLVANQKSIDELNRRLKLVSEEPMSIERFRPNIIVESNEPWGEDVWKTLRIGGSGEKTEKKREGVTMDVVCRCARCQVPNVNPETGVKNKKQPWDTLMSYRRIDRGITFKPCFGMLCAPREEGDVEVGMEFEVTDVTEQHFFLKSL